ncbi:MAG TPA: AmmeMemoRadiSam system radical SAM enzyme [Methanomassiliicoccales archaeon]|nr:AmmeMemoRadiSam system radical SAM enzyme [Methanomassiliicoccales archaeon]
MDGFTARWWSKEDESVRCELCPHRCLLAEGKTGICRTRRNLGNELKSLSYGHVCASTADPIEKKPIFHFRPGSRLFSLGTFGCNLRCDNCQNYVVAWANDGELPCEIMRPEDVVRSAREKGVEGIAWTYNEPIVWLEFILDTASLAKEKGFYIMLNTNGFISEKALNDALPLVDVMNIDVKAFSEAFYKKNCGGHLDDVLRTCRMARAAGIHVELTYLLIPGMNDSKEEVDSFFRWVVETMGPSTPVHLYRFLPSHRLAHLPAQTMERIEQAYTDAKEAGILYPYVGGVVGDRRQSTFCPKCGELLIDRRSEEVTEKIVVKTDEVSRFCPTYPDVKVLLEGRQCPKCGFDISIIR